MRSDLPSGTVTFLFTDIEGSTRLLHELGDAYAQTLAEHRRVLRAAFAAHGGVEVDTQGDAFFVAFARASDALAAAEAGRVGLEPGPVRVRIGVHTGEPVVTEEGYVGIDVHAGARIAAAGHGGQIVVSEATARLAADADLRDLGRHRLKDLTAPVRLFQLGEGDFPRLKTLYGTNLPVQPGPLVGRERELAEAGAQLRAHRVVTLVGPGGSGKTRLALQLAAEAAEEFPDGVWWVPLQALRDEALVEPAIAQALGAKVAPAEHVGEKRMLLLLDNFEQVVGAAGALADLVAAAPNVRLLVTSREPLRIRGEARYAVEPLAESDAVRLFLERARAVEPSFAASTAVADLCRRLDGLPLAIELAAARVNVLDAEGLRARLEQRLPLLTGGARDAPERQRTLRATIEWSYDLLSSEEQLLFRRVAVFSGSFDLEAAVAVCDADLDALSALVDKSLVRRWGSGRLGLLETVHEYAAALLDGSDEADAVRRRHAEHYAALGEDTWRAVRAMERSALARAEADHDNSRAALAWSTGHGERSLALRLVWGLCMFWIIRGHGHEGRRWAERALALSGKAEAPVEAYGLVGASELYRFCGDVDRAIALKEQAIPLLRPLDRGFEAATLTDLAHLLVDRPGELERARRLADEALAIRHDSPSPRGIAHALFASARVRWASGDRDEAIAMLEQVVGIDEGLGLDGEAAVDRELLGDLLRRNGDLDRARVELARALAAAVEIGAHYASLACLRSLGSLAADERRDAEAARLWGAAEALLAEAGHSLDENPSDYAEQVAGVRERLGAAAFERERESGSRLSRDEAFALARATVSNHTGALVD